MPLRIDRAVARLRSVDLDPPRVAFVALTVLPALTLAVLGWSRRWTHDDGFINYRIVTMLRSGHGPVFNIGERVEAYTSPLWVGVLSVGDLLTPLQLEWIGVTFGIAIGAAGMVALVLGSRRLTGTSGDRWWLPLGVLVLLAVPPMWDFTTSGLENSLTLCWLGLVVVVLGRWSTGARPPTTAEAVLVGLGPLVRPEAAIYTVLVLALLLGARWSRENWRIRLRVLGAALAIPVAYQLFRMAYFAAVVPNTALAKSAQGQRWTDGWRYLDDLVGTYLLVMPLVLTAVGLLACGNRLHGQRRLALAVLPVGAVLHTVYVVRSGGDYMHARLLLAPLVAFVAPCAVVPLRALRGPALAGPLVAVLVLWAGVSGVALRTDGLREGEHTWIVDQRSSQVDSIDVAHPVTAEQQGWGRDSDLVAFVEGDQIFLDREPLGVPPAPGVRTPLLATHGLGLPSVSVSPSVHVFDRLGLADALTSRFEVPRRGLIGHEKPIPGAWLNARLSDELASPDLFVVGPGGPGVRPLHESTPASWSADVAAARRALECEPLRRLDAATTEPLTPGRAVRNLVEAPGLTRLTIPADPTVAITELC